MTKIFMLCPECDGPTGGIRILYRHVDTLIRHGYEAFIYHEKEGFRCKWFDHSTPILYYPQARIGPDDILVIPEVYGPDAASRFPGTRKVMFNQNVYLTFHRHCLDQFDMRTPYTHPDVIGAIVVSEDNRQCLEFAFPKLRLFRLHYGFDTRLFAYRSDKKRRIAFMPRKNERELLHVINLLKQRQALRGFGLVVIDGCPEAQVARLLGECLLFLSFGTFEGCPMPPLEAMASGCVVIGYHGRGGREYFHEEFCWPIETGDVVGFARAVEEVIRLYETDPASVLRQGELAAAYVRQHYSPEREEADIVSIWRSLLAGDLASQRGGPGSV